MHLTCNQEMRGSTPLGSFEMYFDTPRFFLIWARDTEVVYQTFNLD